MMKVSLYNTLRTFRWDTEFRCGSCRPSCSNFSMIDLLSKYNKCLTCKLCMNAASHKMKYEDAFEPTVVNFRSVQSLLETQAANFLLHQIWEAHCNCFNCITWYLILFFWQSLWIVFDYLICWDVNLWFVSRQGKESWAHCGKPPWPFNQMFEPSSANVEIPKMNCSWWRDLMWLKVR